MRWLAQLFVSLPLIGSLARAELLQRLVAAAGFEDDAADDDVAYSSLPHYADDSEDVDEVEDGDGEQDEDDAEEDANDFGDESPWGSAAEEGEDLQEGVCQFTQEGTEAGQGGCSLAPPAASSDNSLVALAFGLTGLATAAWWLCAGANAAEETSQRHRSLERDVADPLPQRRGRLSWLRRDALSERPGQTVGPLLLPSGLWKGYATMDGSERRHEVCELKLGFKENGSVVGDGVDTVGSYVIAGAYGHMSRRVAFDKAYMGVSTNVSLGRGSYDSAGVGHNIEYRGELVGGTDAGAEALAGIRGRWSIRGGVADAQHGLFHLWPTTSARLVVSEGDFESVLAASTGLRGAVFKAAEGGECVVCYEQPIGACLLPCGHVAMCGDCAGKVDFCPICRTEISQVAYAANFFGGNKQNLEVQAVLPQEYA
eukprot:TRINITY_DN23066_c1_g1_i1.p1 TRINITY_DN23066_c1_g1~~TRINITY_DN23066_c1_g1_i1.p1  ORF type:complete len:427 (+),score=73.08 TRINITY_DN23066_c1_g1_i1:71-1351(+)